MRFYLIFGILGFKIVNKGTMDKGSPLAPILANIFMGFYESKWLNENNLNKRNGFYDMLITF